MMLKMNLKSLPRISALQPLYRMPLSLVIEAWINPLSALTPSLILHNLELIGIEAPQSLTVTIDRGHYDCMDTNYAVIVVEATSPVRLPTPVQSSVCCSFFSHSVTRGMDPGALYPHWLGNCYVHFGHNREALCSYRHEAGRTKTWNLESGSVDPVSNTKKTTKIQIVQLQKKALLLRTELDVWKAEVRDLKTELMALKAELGTVKADQVGLAQRHKEPEAWANRANKCMQDWTNQQIIERVRILEETQPQPQPQPKKCKCKAHTKEIKQLSERLVLLENANALTQACNPFDFKQICDYADMPALDLIANHYQCAASNNGNNGNNGDSSDDDDCFIQVVVEK